MTALDVLLIVLGTAGAIAYAGWWYRAREEPVSGRGWAAALRAAALALAWALLINPPMPPLAAERGSGVSVALLDASHSMSRPGGDSVAPWQTASDSVRRFESVWLFGGAVPLRVRPDSIPEAPIFRESRLAPALRSVVEAGAREAVLFTDGAITDLRDAVEVARRAGLQVRVGTRIPAAPQIGIAGIDAPAWVQAGDSARVGAELVAGATTTDSIGVELIDEMDRTVASARIRSPDAGRFVRVELGFLAESPPGLKRYRVRLTDEVGTIDPELRDDVRPVYIRVAERPAAPVLISLRPDWEPSFLLSNLDRLTDVAARPYLWVGERMVSVRDGYAAVEIAEVVRAARDAPLLVMHGYGPDAPGWARDLVRDAQRLLVFPAGAEAFSLPGWEIRIGATTDGEWYLAGEQPESPLAIQLGDVSELDLPPVRRVREVEGPGVWSPVTLQRTRRGAARPGLRAGRVGERRWAVAAADGYWRWAFRPGGGRSLYRALWTGIGGWLMEGRTESVSGLDVVRRVVELDEPLRWILPPELDSAVVELADAEGDTVERVTAVGGDTLAVRLEPGRYGYAARGYSDGELRGSAAGPAEVEEFSEELLHERITELAAAFEPASDPAADSETTRPRRGLATLGWPYLLIIGLLCLEWILRRFMGLR